MSAYDDLKKLDEQRLALLKKAQDELLKKANDAIAELNALGFKYRLVSEATTVTFSVGTRRTGIRNEVQSVVAAAGRNGIPRAAVLEKMDAKGDKKAEASISNALAALKKAGDITQDDAGNYKSE